MIEWLRRHYDKHGEHIAYLRMNGTNEQNNVGIYLASTLSQNDPHNHFYAKVTRRNVLVIRGFVNAKRQMAVCTCFHTKGDTIKAELSPPGTSPAREAPRAPK